MTTYDKQFEQAYKLGCEVGELLSVGNGVVKFRTWSIPGYNKLTTFLREQTGIKWNNKKYDWVEIFTSYYKTNDPKSTEII